ncbi:hypothetical protein BJV78DRAFT_1139054 [Lactifluus subvellereus]|nr:hypothetical protein BJV78DRAFT_1139054 [Lactifluus subvellereus]
MPSPWPGAGAVPQALEFYEEGEHAGLLFHSPHSILFQDVVYPTAMHLFEAHKFLDHRPDLAERIRRCERIEEVTAISAELADFARRDWENISLVMMDEVLYLKFCQHGDLGTLLLNTYPADLVHADSRDPFWGLGVGVSMNELGESLMRVRERLRAERSDVIS